MGYLAFEETIQYLTAMFRVLEVETHVAPQGGHRYDGVYRVSGFMVYMLDGLMPVYAAGRVADLGYRGRMIAEAWCVFMIGYIGTGDTMYATMSWLSAALPEWAWQYTTQAYVRAAAMPLPHPDFAGNVRIWEDLKYLQYAGNSSMHAGGLLSRALGGADVEWIMICIVRVSICLAVWCRKAAGLVPRVESAAQGVTSLPRLRSKL